MNAPHAISYGASAQPRPETAAARRAAFLSEQDFTGVIAPPPIEAVLPPAAPAPRDGLLDFSAELGLPWPATLPGLLAGTRALPAGSRAALAADAGAAVVLVLEGSGTIKGGGESVEVAAGDVLCVPGGEAAVTAGLEGLRYYFVDDSPLARYLGWGVRPGPRSALTHWPAAALAAKLEETAAQGVTASGVFLSHQGLAQEKLATPNLFAHLNRVVPGAANTVHAHAAAALTYVISANERSYSLLGPRLEGTRIVNPVRVDWHPGQVSITPPNLWHGHFNEGDTPMVSLVVQPSGLYYNDRTMNFVFAGA